MTQDGVVAGGGALTDWISLGVLASSVPRDVVDEAVAATGRGARRAGGKLPPHVVVYLVMALALFADEDYEEVAARLTETLQGWGCWGQDWEAPTKGAITQARQRLGPEPLAGVFGQVAEPVADLDTAGAFLGPWRPRWARRRAGRAAGSRPWPGGCTRAWRRAGWCSRTGTSTPSGTGARRPGPGRRCCGGSSPAWGCRCWRRCRTGPGGRCWSIPGSIPAARCGASGPGCWPPRPAARTCPKTRPATSGPSSTRSRTGPATARTSGSSWSPPSLISGQPRLRNWPGLTTSAGSMRRESRTAVVSASGC